MLVGTQPSESQKTGGGVSRFRRVLYSTITPCFKYSLLLTKADTYHPTKHTSIVEHLLLQRISLSSNEANKYYRRRRILSWHSHADQAQLNSTRRLNWSNMIVDFKLAATMYTGAICTIMR